MGSPLRSDSTASSASSASAAVPAALPTEEALQTLLSPDGYYKYLAIPKPEPGAHGPKYQAAMAAGGAPVDSGDGVDLERVKKNYRRLSLKHHPDRPTGDAECFRMLNRAKVVLSSPKLRREYDLVGLDLEDDLEDEGHQEDGSAAPKREGEDGGEAHHEDAKDESKSKTETVMGHLASATLAAVLQVVVRTALMGVVSTLISRYTILTFLAVGLLAFLSTKMYAAVKAQLGPDVKVTLPMMKDVLSPLVIALGILCMYRGRRFVVAAAGDAASGVAGDSTAQSEGETYLDWSWTFHFGEVMVMTCFIANSFEKRSVPLTVVYAVVSFLLSLFLGGRFWRYLTMLGFEGVIALLVVLAFPIMEMILESIVEEKMRKVGEKIRKHDERTRELLRRKHEEGTKVKVER
ncbi:hypothetical protein ACHAXT_002126 [Thalassiosira profunda]